MRSTFSGPIELEQLLVRDAVVVDQLADRSYAVDAAQLAGLLLVLVETLHVEAALEVDASLRVAHGDDLVPGACEEPGHVVAGVPEALDGYPRLGRLEAAATGELLDHDEGAAARRLVSAQAPSHGDRFSGDDARRLDAFDGLVLVGHPAHDARVRVDVRGRDIDVGAHEVRHGAHVGTR
jgi:hypothetical protein